MLLRPSLASIAYLIALLMFVSGIVAAALGNSILEVVTLSGSLIIACSTFLAERIDRVENRLLVVLPALQVIGKQFETNTAGAAMMRRAAENFHDLTNLIAQGRVPVSSEAELLQALVDVASSATSTIHSVDQISLDLWQRSERLSALLDAHRAASSRGVEMIRVRIVDEGKLEDPDYRKSLRMYLAMQEAVGVKPILCPRRVLMELGLWPIERGWMLADRADPKRIAGTYGILVKGTVKEGAVYLGPSPETNSLSRQLDAILTALRTSPPLDVPS